MRQEIKMHPLFISYMSLMVHLSTLLFQLIEIYFDSAYNKQKM